MIRTAAIRLSAGERWLGDAAPIARVSRTMVLIAGASLLGHVAVASLVAVTARADTPPPTEIAVEIVQDIPKPTPEPTKAEASKPEAPKLEAAKPEPATSEPPKPEPPKPDPSKPEPAKAEAPKPEPVKSEPPPPKPARSAHRLAAKAPPRDDAAQDRKLAALQNELESLRAEQARLQSDAAAEAEQPPVQTPVALRDAGLGLLPGSFQAVALPNTTDGAGEAASYEEVVFSALAKAKGIGRRQGVPGTAGVRFTLDAGGKLVAVELVHWSGIPQLDSEALDLVRRAVFPPPPQGARRTFEANVNFEVR